MELMPLDVVVFDGRKGNLLHKVIEWRSLDRAVHCTIIRDPDGSMYDPDLKGIHISNLSEYSDWNYDIYRYAGQLDGKRVLDWLDATRARSTGYDLHQWVFGFVLGITAKSLADDESAWTCAELPYWAFRENGYRLTSREEILPMPRLFRYSGDFELVGSHSI